MDPVKQSIINDGYVIIDDFLYPDVVDELHQSAINSKHIDDDYSEWGYHSINFDREKFPFPLLPDVINAIHGAFSPLHSLEFDRGWAFVYNNEDVAMETTVPDLMGSLKVIKSEENQVFIPYIRFIGSHKSQVNQLMNERSKLETGTKAFEDLSAKIDKINKVHNYLENTEHVGKVLSFSSIIQVATKLNNNKELGTLEMGVLYSKIPETVKSEIIDPYISIKDNEARISLRVKDSSKNLRRNDLIKKINFDMQNEIGLSKEEFKLGGVLILFNNLLQSLFKSQILTLGLVMCGIMAMFLVLFRNLRISLIGVIPNFIAAFSILGLIGVLGIPLDMMTITIAAITIGIAVDNSIHYIYRFKEEYEKNNNYEESIQLCHSTVGVAILNTSITIIFGFSILVLSNFIPTIYFGVFTGIAMFLAMILVLTLLPSLILYLRPFEKKLNV